MSIFFGTVKHSTSLSLSPNNIGIVNSSVEFVLDVVIHPLFSENILSEIKTIFQNTEQIHSDKQMVYDIRSFYPWHVM